jgi:hypothetical protein
MQKISNLYLTVIFVMLNFYYKSKKVKYTKLYVPELIEINVLSINPTKESNCEHLFSIISWNISSVRQCFLIKIPEKTVRHHIIYIYIYFFIYQNTKFFIFNTSHLNSVDYFQLIIMLLVLTVLHVMFLCLSIEYFFQMRFVFIIKLQSKENLFLF